MATRIATLTYRLQDDASAALLRIAAAEEKVGTAGRAAQGGMQSFGSSADRATKQIVAADVASQALRGTLMGLGAGAILGGLAGLVAGFVGVGKASLSARGQLAAYQASLQAMTGSHEQALAISKQVAEFADRTPFQTATLEKATQVLLAYNFSAAELIPTLTMAGDTVARFGDLSADKLQEVVKALALVKQGAGGTGEGLEILRRFGVTQTELMAQGVRFNQRTGEFLNVPINRLNLYNAVQQVLLKNQGQMALQAEELPGLYSTFASAMRKLGAAIGEQLEPAAKDFLRTATAMARAATAFIEGGGLQQLGAVLSLLVPVLRTAGIFLGLLVSQKMITGVLALAKAMALLGKANIWLLGISIALQLILSNAGAMATLRKLWEQFLPIAKQVWDKIWAVISALKNFMSNLPPPVEMVVMVATALLNIAAMATGLAALPAIVGIGITVATAGALTSIANFLTSLRALPTAWDVVITISNALADAALAGINLALNTLKSLSPVNILISIVNAATPLVQIGQIITAIGGIPAVKTATVNVINAATDGINSVLTSLRGLPTAVHIPVTTGAAEEAPAGSVTPAEVPVAAPVAGTAAVPVAGAEVPAAVPVSAGAPAAVAVAPPVIETATPAEEPAALPPVTYAAGSAGNYSPVFSSVGLGGAYAGAGSAVVGPPGPPATGEVYGPPGPPVAPPAAPAPAPPGVVAIVPVIGGGAFGAPAGGMGGGGRGPGGGPPVFTWDPGTSLPIGPPGPPSVPGDGLGGGMGGGDVLMMAAGGIITSPTRAILGEAGPEAVIPLSRAGGAGFGGGMGGGAPTININLAGGVYTTREALGELADQIGAIFTRKMRLTTSTALMRA